MRDHGVSRYNGSYVIYWTEVFSARGEMYDGSTTEPESDDEDDTGGNKSPSHRMVGDIL